MSVIDASAVLAVIKGERGAEAAVGHLPDAVISHVNLAEVIGRLARDGRDAAEIDAILDSLDLNAVETTAGQARRAGARATIKDLSLGDRFCIALAEERDEPLITADTDWAKLDVSVPLEMIR
ncbi:type II toxin-antitoxin system VapC family toxin [Brevundimonas sp.]|uniref:type II toxin-antitoxin system VapC family toxin n=1 Tax=Brevundimonas sp. TaxID=1871086 RepID=UPI00356AB71E